MAVRPTPVGQRIQITNSTTSLSKTRSNLKSRLYPYFFLRPFFLAAKAAFFSAASRWASSFAAFFSSAMACAEIAQGWTGAARRAPRPAPPDISRFRTPLPALFRA